MTCPRLSYNRISLDNTLLAHNYSTLVTALLCLTVVIHMSGKACWTRAAINDAKTKADEIAREKMQDVTGGIPLPPGMQLPF